MIQIQVERSGGDVVVDLFLKDARTEAELQEAIESLMIAKLFLTQNRSQPQTQQKQQTPPKHTHHKHKPINLNDRF